MFLLSLFIRIFTFYCYFSVIYLLFICYFSVQPSNKQSVYIVSSYHKVEDVGNNSVNLTARKIVDARFLRLAALMFVGSF